MEGKPGIMYLLCIRGIVVRGLKGVLVLRKKGYLRADITLMRQKRRGGNRKRIRAIGAGGK